MNARSETNEKKQRFSLLLALALILFGIAAWLITAERSLTGHPILSSSGCIDSDEGIYPKLQGKVSVLTWWGTRSYTDSCNPRKKEAMKWSCGDGKPLTLKVKCECNDENTACRRSTFHVKPLSLALPEKHADGSLDAPFLTFESALANAEPGDLLSLDTSAENTLTDALMLTFLKTRPDNESLAPCTLFSLSPLPPAPLPPEELPESASGTFPPEESEPLDFSRRNIETSSDEHCLFTSSAVLEKGDTAALTSTLTEKMWQMQCIYGRYCTRDLGSAHARISICEIPSDKEALQRFDVLKGDKETGAMLKLTISFGKKK